jgi:DNA (cytosine-5)-methyltransferase 1
MARAGLGSHWNCQFSNDINRKKSDAYEANWGAGSHVNADINALVSKKIPGNPNLVWASFPCQDLSLAGNGAGLSGDRSGTFWPFWKLMNGLINEGRAPDVIVLENVCGALTSNAGQDFSAISEMFSASGYRFGAVVVDAALFVPQSRPRLFFIGVRLKCSLPDGLVCQQPHLLWHTRALTTAVGKFPEHVRNNWVWWNLALPRKRVVDLVDILENDCAVNSWHSPDKTQALLAMMTDVNLDKVREAMRVRRRAVGTLYKRTRPDLANCRMQRAEVRFDNVAGCLRTPGGGSSRQTIVVVDCDTVRTRLITKRETARLMGLPDTYKLPENYNDAYHLTGDGVVVPVVRYLAQNILEPILDEPMIIKSSKRRKQFAA